MSDTLPEASDNGGAWGFSKKDAARIAHTVKRIEAQRFNGPAERARYPVAGANLIFPAQLTAALAAGTIAAPSTATATRLFPTGTSGALATDPDSPDFAVYNTYTSALAFGGVEIGRAHV